MGLGLRRLVTPLAFMAPALFCSCKCSHRAAQSARTQVSGDRDASSARAGAGLTSDAPVFSAPLGAVRGGDLDVAAGLVAAEGTIRLIGFRDGGQVWSADVLRGVAWAPD